MHFFSFFKTLVGKEVVVELKNDLSMKGTLHSVDQYLNIKLTDVHVVDEQKFPHLIPMKNCFLRGSVIRYVHLPKADVDIQVLQDSSRRASRPQGQVAAH
jgi:U6 snRNA-associated Sm-like protein LSm2